MELRHRSAIRPILSYPERNFILSTRLRMAAKIDEGGKKHENDAITVEPGDAGALRGGIGMRSGAVRGAVRVSGKERPDHPAVHRGRLDRCHRARGGEAPR